MKKENVIEINASENQSTDKEKLINDYLYDLRTSIAHLHRSVAICRAIFKAVQYCTNEVILDETESEEALSACWDMIDDLLEDSGHVYNLSLALKGELE